MGVASSSDETSGVASPSILSKVSVKGGKADMDAFMTEGRVDNVQIGYVTKKQVGARPSLLFNIRSPTCIKLALFDVFDAPLRPPIWAAVRRSAMLRW